MKSLAAFVIVYAAVMLTIMLFEIRTGQLDFSIDGRMHCFSLNSVEPCQVRP